MPAPKMLSGLPKPVLFALYGAVGGLLGALVFGEPLYAVLEPEKAATGRPEPEVAVAASPEIPLPLDGSNPFVVEIARGEFDEPVTVRFENLPAGVTIDPITIAKGQTKGNATATARGAAVAVKPIKVIAEAKVGGKPVTGSTSTSVAVSDPSRPQADIMFVLDVTASMQNEIDGVKNGVRSFAAALQRNKIDFRIGLVAFRDLTFDGPAAMQVLKFRGDVFTSDAEAFRDQVGTLLASGGGDIPESSLEAVTEATNQPFRKSATKVILLITDAPPKVLDQNARHSEASIPAAVQRVAGIVKNKGIDSVHLVVPNGKVNQAGVANPVLLPTYEPLREAGLEKAKGEFFELADVGAGVGFDTLLNKFSVRVTEAAKAKNPEGKLQVAGEAKAPELGQKSLQSNKEYTKGSGVRLAILSAVWTAAIAALVCLALVAGQHHYLRGTLPDAMGLGTGLGGGLVAGLVGGAAGQALYMIAPDSKFLTIIFLLFGWALLGGLAGVGLSLFIPNLKKVHGLAGGAIGGVVGAIGFMLVSSFTGDIVGRLVGGFLVGFCIGLMVAIVEAAFRRAWLEVRYGERETITVNLGPEPVKIGGDGPACTVWARGAPPLALRYFIRNGQVICEDSPTRTESTVSDGDAREVGNVRLTVRTGTSAAPVENKPPTRPAPAPKRTPEPAPVALDDDPMPMPMPVSPPPAAPKPAAAPPRPTAPAPAPVQAAKPSGPRDPDACPGCGRKNPGRPGARYCMLCDNTY
ncbi:MAG: VWA domain-containing protein [Planctomycetes bacterium]|nr:VWA domain-containing protein [Planctomycetota bacterium]